MHLWTHQKESVPTLAQSSTSRAIGHTRRKCLCYSAGALLHHPTSAWCPDPCPKLQAEGMPKTSALYFLRQFLVQVGSMQESKHSLRSAVSVVHLLYLGPMAEVQDRTQALCTVNVYTNIWKSPPWRREDLKGSCCGWLDGVRRPLKEMCSKNLHKMQGSQCHFTRLLLFNDSMYWKHVSLQLQGILYHTVCFFHLKWIKYNSSINNWTTSACLFQKLLEHQ